MLKINDLAARAARFIKNIEATNVVACFAVVALSFGALNFRSDLAFFQASLLNQQEVEFDGTVYPVQKSINWVKSPAKDWKKRYNEVSNIVDMFEYDAGILNNAKQKINWNDPADVLKRNTIITYSVPYMGSYKLESGEFAGSHLAVDIKALTGTPVHSMANGIVSKAESKSSGFGKHVVIKHFNAPSLEDPSITEDLYSSYSHLDTYTVNVGDVVKKGQVIGTIGGTGTSTTPHLHFQIDRDSAPWHPYWPFSSKEAREAGMSFFEAVNSGLGKEKAIKHTVHPFDYIHRYRSANNSVAPSNNTRNTQSSDSSGDKEVVNTDVVETKVEDTGVINPTDDKTDEVKTDETVKPEPVKAEEKPNEVEDDSALNLEIKSDDLAVIGEQVSFKIEANNPKKVNRVMLALTDDVGTLTRDELTSGDFVNGVAVIKVKDLANGEFKLKAQAGGQDFYSPLIDVVSENYNQRDYSDDKTASETDKSEFTDVKVNHKNYRAIRYLKDKKIVKGYKDGSFGPDNPIARVEVLKMVLAALDYKLEQDANYDFTDAGKNDWYTPYLATAVSNGIVKGYPDNSFRPSNTVNVAEFFKILVESMNEDVDQNLVSQPYFDVYLDDWFAPYAEYARQKRLLNSSLRNFQGKREITRGEVSEAIYRALIIKKHRAAFYSNNYR